MTKKKLLIITIVLFLFFTLGAVGVYGYYVYHSVTSEAIDLNTEELAVNTKLPAEVINIALFGLDGRDDSDVAGDRTDVIMIGTLDTRDNTVKVTSVMRDTYVKISVPDSGETIVEDSYYAGDLDGIEWETTDENVQVITSTPDGYVVTDTGTEDTTYDDEDDDRVSVDYDNQSYVAHYDKINAAYTAGGVEASIKTLNENFDLNIQDYITVDFNVVMDVIDILGGITIDIPNEDVLDWTNEYLKESNFYGDRDDPELTEIGVQTVTGAQALAFARNRYSDSDYGRTMRQREVVQGIFDKAVNTDIVTAIGLLNAAYPHVKTSLSLQEMTTYARAVVGSDFKFDDYRIPTNAYGTGGYLNKIWYLFPDTLVDNAVMLHKFIYGENDHYTPSSTVEQISQVIEDTLNYDAYDLQPNLGSEEEDKMLEDGTEDSTENTDLVTEELNSPQSPTDNTTQTDTTTQPAQTQDPSYSDNYYEYTDSDYYNNDYYYDDYYYDQ